MFREPLYDVFLSHSYEDAAFVRALASRLEADGVRCFLDSENIRWGEAIPQAIVRGLEASRHVVFVLSPSFLGSQWTAWELYIARQTEATNAEQRLLPLLLADCDVPAPLRPSKYFDCRTDAALATVYPQILDALRGKEPGRFDPSEISGTASPGESSDRPWIPHPHPIEHEPHFQGRSDELSWLARETRDRPGVLSILGEAGSGKTVLLEHFLHLDMGPGRPWSDAFTWSFDRDPNPGRCLHELAAFLGLEPTPGSEDGSATTYGICRALEKGPPVLLAFDALERVLEPREGRSGRLRHPAFRLFLERIAWGCGGTRALCTSRSSLAELESRLGKGYAVLELEALPLGAFLGLLRARGVQPGDRLLDAEGEGGCHALTASFAGVLLAEFGEGKTGEAGEGLIDRVLAAAPEEGLPLVLDRLNECLAAEEVALMEVVSTRPFPSNAAFLLEATRVVEGWPEGRSPSAGLAAESLDTALFSLKQRGLLSTSRVPGDAPSYTVHSLVRAHYLRRCPAQLRMGIHKGLGVFLTSKLGPPLPREDEALDRGEELLHHIGEEWALRKAPLFETMWELLAEQEGDDGSPGPSASESAMLLSALEGATQVASLQERFEASRFFNTYWNGLGHFPHLGRALGAHARGARIVESFFLTQQAPFPYFPLYPLLPEQLCALLNDLAFFKEALGQVDEAIRISRLLEGLAGYHANANDHLIFQTNRAELLSVQGRLPEAEVELVRILKKAEGSSNRWHRRWKRCQHVHGVLALVLLRRGCLPEARFHFAKARGFQNKIDSDARELYSTRGLAYAELLLRTGELWRARRVTEANLPLCQRNDAFDQVMDCQLLLAEIRRRGGEVAAALDRMSGLRDTVLRSGRQSQVCGYLLIEARCRAGLRELVAASEATREGISIARSCGFRDLQVDLLNQRGWIEWVQGDPAAEGTLREALALATEADCDYAWGQADALDLLGRVVAPQEAALQPLEQALKLRTSLEDPMADATRRAIDAVSRNAPTSLDFDEVLTGRVGRPENPDASESVGESEAIRGLRQLLEKLEDP